MSTSGKGGYHHGDLRATLMTIAMGMLEQGRPFSLRAIAREAGVSATAPYRHFADRDALESALAAQGLRDLKADLLRGGGPPATVADLAELGVGYVDFALRRPALFRLMFGNPCDDTNDERVRAAAEVHELLAGAVSGVFPEADPVALATAGWGLVHGLACLYLDGKLAGGSAEDVAGQVRSSFTAIFTARPAIEAPDRHLRG
ncbi:TetR/AcrR family transcriptional regulator [Amycolatopsis sp.]|uniref:TetR/AcrR family transcriptional regulator n=1 Tax=Amycolatopsis sp. TaxID=37632 RepID=UPI002BF863CE|nr:TetR/AcrR family transcriptional regulator [Amycolatopsis sp.]HVV11442.1 TetR/AcrR family transcriptional regulator [Amycolatopsis sp.]